MSPSFWSFLVLDSLNFRGQKYAKMMRYLPDCVVNSIKNPTVTLTVMLETLEEPLSARFCEAFAY